MSNMTKQQQNFERELRQEEYEIQKALEDSIIYCKKGGMTRTSFHNMLVRQCNEMLKARLGTTETATQHIMKCLRIWDTEDLR